MKVRAECLYALETAAGLLETIQGFWLAMYSWEKWCSDSYNWEAGTAKDFQNLKLIARPRLKEIFAQYVATTDEPKRIRDGSLNFGSPPKYNPEQDEVVLVEKARGGFRVHVQCSGYYTSLYEYKIVTRDGQWKLVDRKVMIDDEERVISCL